MKQTRRTSLIESVLNVILGISVGVAAQTVVFPWFNLQVTLAQSTLIACIFSVVSIGRSFLVRRWFEHLRVSGWLP